MNLWNFRRAGGKRSAICWHRRAGKDLFAINEIAYCACPPEGSHPTARIGLYWHILPTFNQGRKVIWEGITNDGKKFIDHFPHSFIKGEGGINNQEMRISFNNGSTYQVLGGDDPDRLVGSNPVGIVISEYSIIPEKTWHYLMPILNANDGWAIFIFTPRGENHAFNMINQAKTNPKWFSEVLTVDDTYSILEDGSHKPIVTKEDIEEDRKNGMDDSTIQQEYYGSFKASLSGAYYGEYMDKLEAEGKITNVPLEPLLPVFTAWDLGINDQTVITLFQVSPAGEIRIIDCISAAGEGFAYYLRQLRDKPYNYATHFFPWDMAIREGSTGLSRLDTIRSMGLRNCQIVQKSSIEDGIEAVRNILPKCWFDKSKTSQLIKALKSYHKEYDESKQTFKSAPVHDWASDYADSFRYLAMSQKRFKTRTTVNQSTAYKPYSIL